MNIIYAALSMMAASTQPSVAAELHPMSAIKTRVAPVIDGQLEEDVWSRAAKTGEFKLTGGGGEADVQTKALVTYDDEFLFVGFRCDEPSLPLLKTSVTRHDAPVQKDDSVEIFVQAEDGGEYYHMMISCQGITAEQRCVPGGRRDRTWNPKFKLATGRGKSSWSVELAVPWLEMGVLPCLGANLRANFCRNRHAGGKVVNSSWSPMVTFHDNSRFGQVKGLVIDPRESRKAKVRIVRAEIPESLDVESSVSVTLESSSEDVQSFFVELTVQHQGKERKRYAMPLRLQPRTGESKTFKLNDLEPGEHTFQVSVFDIERKEVIYRSPMARRNLSIQFTAYLDRSYYTGEKEAIYWLEQKPPSRVPAAAVVTISPVQKPGEKLLEIQTELRDGVGAAKIPLGQLELGDYRVTCSIQGEVKATAVLTKLTPMPDEVKTERRRRVLLVNDRPFFPIGIYGAPEESFKELSDSGFNTVVRWQSVQNVESILAYMNSAQQHGLKVIDHYGGRGNLRARYNDPQFPQKFEQLLEVVRNEIPREKRHPSLLSYYSLDEPATKHKPQVQKAYELFRRIDPYHPVTLLTIKRVNPALVDYCDISAVDAYWSPYRDQTPLVVSSSADESWSLVESRRQPFIMVVLCGTYSGAVRELTPREQRCQTYLSLIHGARGVLWFTYRPMSGLLWNEVKSLAGEIKKLSPVLLSGAERQMFLSTDGSVHALAINYGKNTHIIAANVRSYPVRCSFHIGESSTPERELAPYGTAHFEVDLAFGKGRIEAQAVKRGKQEVTPEKLPVLNVPGNLIKNPSFEKDVDRNGIPDGWKFEAWDDKHSGVMKTAARTGKHSIYIDKPNSESASQFISDSISLSPKTEYVLQFHLKAELNRKPKEFGHAAVVLMNSKKGSPYDSKTAERLKVYNSTEWRSGQARFTTGKQAEKIRVWCRLYSKVIGRAWFDDIYLGKASDFERALPVDNLIFNGSFERATNPDTPDGWFYQEHRGWNLIDSESAAHGSNSLRMEANHGIYSSYYHGAPLEAGQQHTYSMFMKSDVEGYPVHLRFSGVHPYPHIKLHEKEIKLTTQWHRYSFSLAIEKKARAMMRIYLHGKKGRVWVDGVQCELGTEAHEYVERIRPAGH